ncbi:MAG: lysophospholipid acyltransferase family protein [Pseudomonadota bacterium]
MPDLPQAAPQVQPLSPRAQVIKAPAQRNVGAGSLAAQVRQRKKDDTPAWLDWLASTLAIGIIRLLTLLPYRWRVPVGGWIMASVAGPIAGYSLRIRNNLNLIFPDMPEDEKRKLNRAVREKIGRSFAEMFSPGEIKAIAAETPISGPGLKAAEAAREAGRPVIFVSGHIGNYDVGRAILIQQGHKVGALYRRMNYAKFNTFYVRHLSAIGTPLFERGRKGTIQMINHLRAGNAIAILLDQHMRAGAWLRFFGRRARTALSAGDLALKYDALVVPCYAIRQPDGFSFEMIVEEPIPHSTAEEMTQALNDSLEAQVRAHMDQWFWVHKRWKVRRKRISPAKQEKMRMKAERKKRKAARRAAQSAPRDL